MGHPVTSGYSVTSVTSVTLDVPRMGTIRGLGVACALCCAMPLKVNVPGESISLFDVQEKHPSRSILL